MVRSKGVCPHSVCRIIVGLCSIFVPISLCCKSKSHTRPALLLTLWASLLTPPQERKGGRRRGRVFQDPSSFKDKRLLTPKWPLTPGTHKGCLATRVQCPASLPWRHRPFWSVGFLSITLSPMECDSRNQCQELASPSAQYHLVLGRGVQGPPCPPFTCDHSGADRALVVESTSFQVSFSLGLS